MDHRERHGVRIALHGQAGSRAGDHIGEPTSKRLGSQIRNQLGTPQAKSQRVKRTGSGIQTLVGGKTPDPIGNGMVTHQEVTALLGGGTQLGRM